MEPTYELRAREAISSIDSLLPSRPLPVEALAIGGPPGFASAFEVDVAALAASGAANLAFGHTTLDPSLVAATFAGGVLVDGEPVPGWASLSGFYATSNERRLQLHCNFPHHAAGVVERLGCEATRDAVQEAILDWNPLELEAALIADGMIAAYLRTPGEWERHDHARATSHLPVLTVEQIGEGVPRTSRRPTRVLDCSRVLAGPVAGHMFASHGADVLRVDGPHLPSVDMCVMVSGAGKRNTALDLRKSEGSAAFAELLTNADVWIDAYRPGALASNGFDLDRVAPGSVVVQLSAFDWVGPWAGRRGFDSIVQSTTGIVEAGSTWAESDEPVPLPVQALDYATGLLAAYAGERIRQHQREVGGTWLVRVSLLRTRNWLVGLGAPKPFTPAKPQADSDALATMASDWGHLTIPKPVSGTHHTPPAKLGTAQPTWL